MEQEHARVHTDTCDIRWDTSTEAKHPVFGKVIEGKHVVSSIESVTTDKYEKPKAPIVMNVVTIAGYP